MYVRTKTNNIIVYTRNALYVPPPSSASFVPGGVMRKMVEKNVWLVGLAEGLGTNYISRQSGGVQARREGGMFMGRGRRDCVLGA